MSLAAKRQFCNITTCCGMVSKWKWVWSTLVSCDTLGFPYRMIPQTIRGHSEFWLRKSTYCSTSMARRCISKRECLRHGKSRNVRLPRWLIARYGIQRVLQLRMSRQASRPPVDRVVNLPAFSSVSATKITSAEHNNDLTTYNDATLLNQMVGS
jgi:hypothetical protein